MGEWILAITRTNELNYKRPFVLCINVKSADKEQLLLASGVHHLLNIYTYQFIIFHSSKNTRICFGCLVLPTVFISYRRVGFSFLSVLAEFFNGKLLKNFELHGRLNEFLLHIKNWLLFQFNSYGMWKFPTERWLLINVCKTVVKSL